MGDGHDEAPRAHHGRVMHKRSHDVQKEVNDT
jgi:hypothetical protein